MADPSQLAFLRWLALVLRTAKLMELQIPQSVLLRVDQVIQ